MNIETMFFFGIIILFSIGLPIGLGWLIYISIKKSGHPKTAKYLIIVYGLTVLTVGIYSLFEDQLFTKHNAKELVEEQQLNLLDDFVILKNESSSAIGDYYHKFILKISERDKQAAIARIKNSEGFKVYASDNLSIIDSILYSGETINRYHGSKVTKNYETENSYYREYFLSSGREGWAPTFRRISISKTKNELTFEDINE